MVRAVRSWNTAGVAESRIADGRQADRVELPESNSTIGARLAVGGRLHRAARSGPVQDHFGYHMIPVTGQRPSAAGLPTARVTMMAWRVPELRSTVARRVRADLGRGASAHQAGSLT